MPRLKFDPQALYEAIDAQRRERGMTWNELADELRVSTSTIKGMTKRQWGIELDGVMGMTRWLGRTVESFAGGVYSQDCFEFCRHGEPATGLRNRAQSVTFQ
jgi:hypothetical protein